MAETTPSTGINMVNVLAASGHGDVAAKLQNAQYQQMMAQQLMAQGNKEDNINQLANPGGLMIPYSPWQGLAKAADKIGGQYMLQKSLADQLEAYKGLGGQTQGQSNPEQLMTDSTNAAIGSGEGPATQAAVAAQYQQKLAGLLSGGQQDGTSGNNSQYNQREQILMASGAAEQAKAEFEQRMKPSNYTDEAKAKAQYDTVTGPGGKIFPKMQFVGGNTTGQPSAPSVNLKQYLPPSLQPTNTVGTGNPNITPNSPSGKAAISDLNIGPIEDNVTPNPIKGTTPGYDANDPAAVEGAKTTATKGSESGISYQDKLVDESSHALEGKRIMGQMKENLKGFEPGKLADAKSNLAAWGESIGFDKNDLESRLGNVGDVQSFKKLTAQLAIQSIKQISPKATQMEFQRFLENNPNPDLNPDAMNTLIDYTGKTFDLPLKKQQEWTKWKKQGNPISNYSDFDSGWNQNVGENLPSTISLKMEKPTIESGGSSGLSPVEQQELHSLRAKYKNGR